MLVLSLLPGTAAGQQPASAASAQERDLAPPGVLEFLRQTQEHLRIGLNGELIDTRNARWVEGEIRFDYAWSVPNRMLRPEFVSVDPGDLDAVFRRRPDYVKRGLLAGGITLIASTFYVALTDEPDENLALDIGGSTAIGTLLGIFFLDFERWSQVYP